MFWFSGLACVMVAMCGAGLGVILWVSRLQSRISLMEARVLALQGDAAVVSARPLGPASDPVDALASAQPLGSAQAEERAAITTPVAPQPVAAPAVPVLTSPEPPPATPAVAAGKGGAERWLVAAGGLVGALFLILGVGFGLKVVIDAGALGPGVRVAGAAAFGLALIGGGVGLRSRGPVVAEGLAAAGVVANYGAAFAGTVLYTLWPQPVGFAMLAALTVAALLVSVLARWRSMLWAALIGALLTPVILGSDTPQHAFFLGYVALVSVAVVGAALRRSWVDVLVGHALLTGALLAGWSVASHGDVSPWLATVGVALALGGPIVAASALPSEGKAPAWALAHALVLAHLAALWAAVAVDGAPGASALAITLAVAPGLVLARVGGQAVGGWIAGLGAFYAMSALLVGLTSDNALTHGALLALPALLGAASRGTQDEPAAALPLAVLPGLVALSFFPGQALGAALGAALVLLAAVPAVLGSATVAASASVVVGVSALAAAAVSADLRWLGAVSLLSGAAVGVGLALRFPGKDHPAVRVASLWAVVAVAAGAGVALPGLQSAPWWALAAYLASVVALWRRTDGSGSAWLELAAVGVVLSVAAGLSLDAPAWLAPGAATLALGVGAALAVPLGLRALAGVALSAGLITLLVLLSGEAWRAVSHEGALYPTLSWGLAALGGAVAAVSLSRDAKISRLQAVFTAAWLGLAVLYGLGALHEGTGWVAGLVGLDEGWSLPAARSVVWGGYGLTLLMAGVASRSRAVRFAGAALVSTAAVKVFLFDMWVLDGWARVASFVGLGLSLMGSAFLFERLVLRDPSYRGDEDA